MGTCSIGKLCGMHNDRIFVCVWQLMCSARVMCIQNNYHVLNWEWTLCTMI